MSTFLSSFNLLLELEINPSKVYVKVPLFCISQNHSGYSCGLKVGDILPLYDLFYGKLSFFAYNFTIFYNFLKL